LPAPAAGLRLTRYPLRAASSCLVLQHIMIDLGTGNNNKINWAMTDKQEFIDIVETVGSV
jgi:DIM1 family U5 snRNP protein